MVHNNHLDGTTGSGVSQIHGASNGNGTDHNHVGNIDGGVSHRHGASRVCVSHRHGANRVLVEAIKVV